MELTTSYKIYRLYSENNFGQPRMSLLPIQEGDNKFDYEEQAIQWVREREPQERYTEFVILPIYSMV